MVAVTTAVPSVAPSADGRTSALASVVLTFATTPCSVTVWPARVCIAVEVSRFRMSILGSAPLTAAARAGLADSLMSKSVALVVVPAFVSDRPPEWAMTPLVRSEAILDFTIGNVATVPLSVAGATVGGGEPGAGVAPRGAGAGGRGGVARP